MKRALLTIMLGMFFACHANAQESLTYVDLVNRLAGLERLAVLPVEGERCAQWSSYDRATRYNAETNTYENWDANGDGGQFIRQENGQFVMAEMEGPGCIWRIWSARPESGRVRVFLDGAPEPTVDLPFRGYFDRANLPFTYDSLVYESARGWNCYVPIPYQKSCKIVAEKGWGAYYHFTYGAFPPKSRVPTFSRNLTAIEAQALAQANGLLRDAGFASLPYFRPDQQIHRVELTVLPGETRRMAGIPGPRAITGIRMKVDLPPSPEERRVLRELALQITWDNEATPAVWAPLGDFFGTAAGANPYRSLPMGLLEDGWWYSRWYMPFAKEAIVEIINEGAEPRRIECQIMHDYPLGPPEELGRFHAKWHRDAFLPPEPERKIDWTLLKTEGRGRYCGVMLHVWNPKGGWWGEGDEKFHVDGEKFPSTIGTGSEDYFGYAWGCPELFSKPYHSQTISMKNRGHISVNRLHITDNVPFMKSFDGYIEKYFPNDRPCLYAATVYWYLAPGGEDPYGPAPVEERTGYCDWKFDVGEGVGVEGAVEGEKLEVLSKTGGNPIEQDMAEFGPGWSKDAHLWWIDAKPGDTLELALPVPKTGKYRIAMQLTQAPDYGIVRVHLDGKRLSGPIDLYHPEVKPYGPVDLGVHKLTVGQHKLTVEIVGANDKAIKAYMCAIDYIKLEAVP